MKKSCIIILLLAGIILLFFSNPVHAKAKSLIVTTLDVQEPYEIMGIVNYRQTVADFNELVSGIKKAASGLGADAVVGFRCANYCDYFYAYGTAVKFKEKQ